VKRLSPGTVVQV